jgi:fructose-1,6-bisphosphatase I
MIFDGELGQVLKGIAKGGVRIAGALNTVDLGKAGTKNIYGEDQIALDVLSDEILEEEMKLTGLVSAIASEEQDDVVRLEGGKYAVCYDPLDGSSLVDVNLSVGTIFGVYEGGDFVGRKPSEMVAAGFIVYGPRTTMMVTRGDGTYEFRLKNDGEWELAHERIQIGEGKMFAPGNLRAVTDRADYMELVNWWMKEQYTLRYSGGMVPDINQILLKGKGIFTYPGYSDAPNGKLRLLVECGPIAFIVEQAGGAASDGAIRILDKTIEDIAQRSPIYVGSKEEVKRCITYLG